MLRGLYDFRPTNSNKDKTLELKAGERVLFLEPHPSDINWFRVSNIYGKIGIVPSNYVNVDNSCQCDDLIGFLDEAIKNAHYHRYSSSDTLQAIRRNLLGSSCNINDRLMQLRKEVSDLRAKSMSNMSLRQNNTNRRHSEISLSVVQSPKPLITNATLHDYYYFEDDKNDNNYQNTTPRSVYNTPREPTAMGDSIERAPTPPPHHSSSCRLHKSHNSSTSMKNSSATCYPPLTHLENSNNKKNSRCNCHNSASKLSQVTSLGSSTDIHISNSGATLDNNKIDDSLAESLITAVQQSTGLSSQKSQVAVHSILLCIQNHLQGTSEQIGNILQKMNSTKNNSSTNIAKNSNTKVEECACKCCQKRRHN